MKGRDAPIGTKMVQQMSFKVDTLAELREFHTVFVNEGVEIQRTVSHGNAFGMYANDPEGNTIEVYYKTGFDVPQPHGDLVDLTDSEEELQSNPLSRSAKLRVVQRI